MAGFFAPIVICGALLALHVVLPAHRVRGYIADPATGGPYIYRLNGLLVLAAAIGGGLAAGSTGWLDWGWLHRHAWWGAAGATALGALATAWFVLAPPRRAVAKPPSAGLRGWIADFYLGRVGNFAFGGRIDVKMYLYVFGAVLLALNICSYAAYHADRYGSGANPGVYLHAALLGWFLVDYLIFERVHLYTYDIFAERLGAKIIWGCLAFYPYFYAIGLWGVARMPKSSLVESAGGWWLAACAVIFFAGWVLARGANLQKYRFKRFPERSFLGIEPRAVTDERASCCAAASGASPATSTTWRDPHQPRPGPGPGTPHQRVAVALRGVHDPLHADPRARRRAPLRRQVRPLWDRYCEEVPNRIIPRIY